jgi:hypothetical protein
LANDEVARFHSNVTDAESKTRALTRVREADGVVLLRDTEAVVKVQDICFDRWKTFALSPSGTFRSFAERPHSANSRPEFVNMVTITIFGRFT